MNFFFVGMGGKNIYLFSCKVCTVYLPVLVFEMVGYFKKGFWSDEYSTKFMYLLQVKIILTWFDSIFPLSSNPNYS